MYHVRSVPQPQVPVTRFAMPSPAKSSPPKRFRPSISAISQIRPYQRPPPSLATNVASSEDARGAQRKQKKWSGYSRVGRFIRRHNDGRLSTNDCETTLMHVVSVFAAEVAKLAGQLRSHGEAEGATGSGSSRAAAGSSARAQSAKTEERDVRRALARLRGLPPPAAALGRTPPCSAGEGTSSHAASSGSGAACAPASATTVMHRAFLVMAPAGVSS